MRASVYSPASTSFRAPLIVHETLIWRGKRTGYGSRSGATPEGPGFMLAFACVTLSSTGVRRAVLASDPSQNQQSGHERDAAQCRASQPARKHEVGSIVLAHHMLAISHIEPPSSDAGIEHPHRAHS